MAPRRSRLRHYAAHLRHVCPELPTIPKLVRKLRSPETGFGDHRITFPISCTDGHEDGGVPPTCQIFDELGLWNELLWFVKLELREVTPGRLNVVRLPNANVPPNKHQEVQRGVVFLHWLLSEHRCVDSVEADCRLLHYYPQLFCDALQLSKSLRTLKLGEHELEVGTAADLFIAISKSRQLEELECDDLELMGDAKKLQACVADLVRSTTFLKTLRLTGIPKLLDAKVLIEAFRDNSSITRLTVDAPLKPENRVAFYECLASNSRLTALTVVDNSQEIACNVEPLFDGLSKNRTLLELGLEQYRFDLVDASLLSDTLAINTTLQELAFSCCYWESPALCFLRGDVHQTLLESAKERWGNGWRVEPFIHAIRNSASLRRLTFDTNHFSDEEMPRLLAAVKESASFQQLCFDQLSRPSAAQFCDLLRGTGTLDKVKVRNCWSDPALFVQSLENSQEFPSISQHDFHDLESAHLRSICSALLSHDSVTVLYLNGDPTEDVADGQSATFLADYLASTAALKEIHMNLNASHEAVRMIVDGLSRNKSLEKLGIKNWRPDDDDVRAICDWLEQSTTLHHLVWLCERSSTTTVLVSELSRRLRDKYTLVFLRVKEFRENEVEWQVVKDILRRSSSIVECAAHFVLGSTLKRCATAFELVMGHPLVLTRTQELGSMNADEARQRLAASVRRLETDFWQLSGVVKEELVCHERDDGRVQIDDLNYDSWMALRKWLSVADVVDSRPKAKDIARGYPRVASFWGALSLDRLFA